MSTDLGRIVNAKTNGFVHADGFDAVGDMLPLARERSDLVWAGRTDDEVEAAMEKVLSRYLKYG